jgi:CDP-2,3-bis-(O-geranylgeranyl)-sn-glycerol synthase
MNILGPIWFFLPAGIANMAPPLAAKLFGMTPVDAGKSLGKQRIFGDHKTWQGIAGGIAAGTLFFLLQQWLYQFPAVQSISIIDYKNTPWLLGTALGLGALLGDLIKSFFKRRANVKPGNSWIPFDQADYIIGGMLLSLLFVRLPIFAWVVIFVFYFIMHFVVNLFFYAIGFKKTKL